MKHRRLKAAPLRTNAKLTTHDRQAVLLPPHAELAVVTRPDPYEAGAMQTMAASLRGDPLLQLHCRGMIADYQFAAGREWQRYFEMAQISALKGQNFMMEPVDGGGFSAEVLDKRRKATAKAIAKLTYCRAILGETGNAIVTLVLGANMPIRQAALARGMISDREIAYVGQRFRESLNELARVFGYA